MEIIFKSPYLFKRNIKLGTASPQKKYSFASTSTEDKYSLSDKSMKAKTRFRLRSQSVGESSFLENSVEHEKGFENDNVAIIWLDDLHDFKNLTSTTSTTILASLVVHPLFGTPNLFWVKIISRDDLQSHIDVIIFN